MTTLTITGKGQVTLKQELLRHLGVNPGDKIEADKLPRGRILVRAAARDGTISDFIGCLSQRSGPKLRIEEVNEMPLKGGQNQNESWKPLSVFRWPHPVSLE